MNEPPKKSQHPIGAQKPVTVESVDSVDQIQQLVRETDSMLVVGNRTKPVLSSVDATTRLISTRSLAGIIQYEPSEFTFTAFAGTTLAEIEAALAAKNQYLPFDPMLVNRDATIAGTLAAGMSGPGRHRFGGIRDFILGAQFVAGDGQLINSGGKVVKNAAGFDIPKLLVGSCGRLGAITALTFKVFPRPVELHTYHIVCSDHMSAAATIATLARGRWELDAIDYRADSRTIWIRIGGDAQICNSIAADIGKVIGQASSDQATSARSAGIPEVVSIDADQAAADWRQLNDLRFLGAGDTGVAKIPTTLCTMQRLAKLCDDHADHLRLHSSVAGSISWLAFHKNQCIDSLLNEIDLTGLVLRRPNDESGSCVAGNHTVDPIESAVKNAMDPPGRFPSFPG